MVLGRTGEGLSAGGLSSEGALLAARALLRPLVFLLLVRLSEGALSRPLVLLLPVSKVLVLVLLLFEVLHPSGSLLMGEVWRDFLSGDRDASFFLEGETEESRL